MVRYRGRIAPSPTGFLHLGHARTFWTAQQRARQAGGRLLLRNDDLDRDRSRPEFVAAMIEDLRWFGFEWAPPIVTQSERVPLYRAALDRLHAAGCIYPCHRSRRDVLAAAGAPHDDERDEPIYPAAFRPRPDEPIPAIGDTVMTNWRFRVPDRDVITFDDGHEGPHAAIAGVDFGDFLVWRKDDIPSYQLASVVDDIAMEITEVVRGADLLTSTFRQLLLFRALGAVPPAFFHCPLVVDAHGVRLAKRHDALALRTLRERGETPAALLAAMA